jgi:hypothetical protein
MSDADHANAGDLAGEEDGAGTGGEDLVALVRTEVDSSLPRQPRPGRRIEVDDDARNARQRPTERTGRLLGRAGRGLMSRLSWAIRRRLTGRVDRAGGLCRIGRLGWSGWSGQRVASHPAQRRLRAQHSIDGVTDRGVVPSRGSRRTRRRSPPAL